VAITEEVRHRVYEAIRASHGDEVANGLMEMLPPVGWADVATKHDLSGSLGALEDRMGLRFERLEESLAFYRSTFERHGLEYAIWGHVSDGNMHPNVVPGSLEDVHRGRIAILEIARGVMAMGGAPLAEHGVGRSALKQQMLRDLYGDRGIEEMRAVKRALDPEWKFAAGVLFPE